MGKAIAQKFASEGAYLVLSGRDETKGNALAQSLPHSIFLAGDVGNTEYNRELVEAAIQNFGGLDIVSLNAGILGLGNVIELSEDLWNRTISTNLSSIYLLAKFAIPHLKTKKGTILINASIAAFKSFPNHPAYCASKAGAVALMKQLAVEYAPDIRINAMCP